MWREITFSTITISLGVSLGTWPYAQLVRLSTRKNSGDCESLWLQGCGGQSAVRQATADRAMSKWAADKASKEDIRLLRATLNQIETVTATAPIDFDQLQILDAKFHLTIVGIAGNRFINQTLNVLQDVMKMSMETTLRLPGRSTVSRDEHNAILSAIESGNGDLASKLTLQHITGARAVALTHAKEKN